MLGAVTLNDESAESALIQYPNIRLRPTFVLHFILHSRDYIDKPISRYRSPTTHC